MSEVPAAFWTALSTILLSTAAYIWFDRLLDYANNRQSKKAKK